MKLTPYLVFNGRAEEAAAFYADIVGGKIGNLHRYDQCKERIMHTCITFPGGTMGLADTMPDDPKRAFGDGQMLTIVCDSASQAQLAYDKLCKDAKKIHCEMCETFYAKRYAEVTDKFGILWAVMFEE